MNTRAMMLFYALMLAAPVQAGDTVVKSLQSQYQTQGAKTFSAAAGEKLWNQQVADKKGEMRSCPSCHGKDIAQNGQHATTKKVIKPMAASANPKRYTDEKKTTKWLTRNCKWTWGRDCTPQEKGDLLEYLSTH